MCKREGKKTGKKKYSIKHFRVNMAKFSYHFIHSSTFDVNKLQTHFSSCILIAESLADSE